MTSGAILPILAAKPGKPAPGKRQSKTETVQAEQMSNSILSRRVFTLGALAGVGVTAACGNGVGSRGSQMIDARVNATLNEMYNTYPNTRALGAKANAMLVMPLVTEAGLGFGGAYGRGALRVNDVTVDYYSVVKGSGGLQIGAQQYAHVLFFMTEQALLDFRRSPGWAAGADLEYVVSDQGDSINADTTTVLAPVLAAVFGRAGLRIGATLEGTKYTRIIP
jgi:lipid-binding SYLF domain-containing protein